jgi:hypothetical protein
MRRYGPLPHFQERATSTFFFHSMKLPPAFLLVTSSAVTAGPFAADFIPAADPRFTLWATGTQIVRGPSDIAYIGENPYFPTYGYETSATGPADVTTGDNGNPFPVISLGDGGSATLTFAQPFADVPGPDFAVFENAFNSTFLELAHVEVSSDGVNFFRFPSISLTQTNTQIPGYGGLDATNVYNLAGRAPGGSGTPFDLAQLRGHHPSLDVDRVTHVRVIDVVGSLNPAHRTLDSLGNPINDSYPTDHEFGGFDLDAVGAFSAMVTTYANWAASQNLAGNDALPAQDPDHDGVPNLIRYLTGNGTLTVERSPAQTILRFSRLAYRTDGKLRVETGTTLGDWQPLAQSDPGVAVAASPGSPASVSETGENLVQVTITVPSLPGQRFFRLAAEP